MARTLTAILRADVKGYSRLRGVDEDVTIRPRTTSRPLRASLIEPYHSPGVNSLSDTLLGEFPNAVEAVPAGHARAQRR
jgi:hypothetical protein